jgi:enoyl-CoA hydratase/carnithine racemase
VLLENPPFNISGPDSTPQLNEVIVALASMRFASREQALLSQREVGAALAPGGGPITRLSGLIGPGPAMDVLLSGQDINVELA